jgi:hypothetical protein
MNQANMTTSSDNTITPYEDSEDPRDSNGIEIEQDDIQFDDKTLLRVSPLKYLAISH